MKTHLYSSIVSILSLLLNDSLFFSPSLVPSPHACPVYLFLIRGFIFLSMCVIVEVIKKKKRGRGIFSRKQMRSCKAAASDGFAGTPGNERHLFITSKSRLPVLGLRSQENLEVEGSKLIQWIVQTLSLFSFFLLILAPCFWHKRPNKVYN